VINIRHLRAFCAVAEHLHFTKAADAMRLTQPALSALIRQLESDVGVRLIQRNTRIVELTEIGRQFHDTAKKLVTDFDDAVEDVQSYRATKRGRVRIGALPSLCASVLPRLMQEFGASHPDATLSLADLQGEELSAQLRARTIDLAIGYAEPSPDTAMHMLFRDRLVLVCRRDSEFGRSGASIRWARLQEQPLIAMAPGTTVRALIEGVAAKHDIPLKIALEPRLMSTAVACVEAGLGVAILPSSGASGYLRPNLCTRRIIDPVVHRDIPVLHLARYGLPPAPAAFRDFLIAELGRRKA
jgi:LysR family transcriptional regulator, carnitine catabolism transcriptional activator